MMWSMTSRVVTREERLYLDQFKRPSINAYLNLFWYWLVLFLFAGVRNLCGYYWLTLKILLWLIASGYPPATLIALSIFFYSLLICMPSNACLLSCFKLTSSIAYLNVLGTYSFCFIAGPMEYAISLVQSYWLNRSSWLLS